MRSYSMTYTRWQSIYRLFRGTAQNGKKTLKVKIGVRIFERCLIISKEKPQRLFSLFVSYFMAGAFSRPAPPNNPLCGLDGEMPNYIYMHVIYRFSSVLIANHSPECRTNEHSNKNNLWKRKG